MCGGNGDDGRGEGDDDGESDGLRRINSKAFRIVVGLVVVSKEDLDEGEGQPLLLSAPAPPLAEEGEEREGKRKEMK